jgi:hypothetical protein
MARLSVNADYSYMADKEEVRGYVPSELRRLLKAVVALKIDKDWTVSDALEEAISDWLRKPENQAIIEKHRLDER